MTVFANPGHAFLETHGLPPAQHPLDLGDVGPGALRLAGPFRKRRPFAAQNLDQAVHGLGFARTEVEDLAHDGGGRRQVEGAHHVRHIEEVPALRAVAHHRERLSLQLLGQEDAEDGAVGARRLERVP